MIDIIKQRTPNDCGVCCLAMVTGLTYEEVIEKIGLAYEPSIGLTSTNAALSRLGFNTDQVMSETATALVLTRELDDNPIGFRTLAWGRRAIIVLPSLNQLDEFHAVYWDGENVLDPSHGKTYKTWVSLKEPVTITLFREAPAKLTREEANSLPTTEMVKDEDRDRKRFQTVGDLREHLTPAQKDIDKPLNDYSMYIKD